MVTIATAHTVKLPSGTVVPALGQGTWHLGEQPERRSEEIAALRLGVDLGMTIIDTAEMYADGETERLIAEALGDRRDEVFLVSKALPSHASGRAMIAACEGSLRRLGTDHLDLYLLHWRGTTPLEATVETFIRLVDEGKIGEWGVSNFDVADMEELVGVPGGDDVATDQVLYNLSRRGIEFDLRPWCEKRDVAVMAYAPFEQARLLAHPALRRIAARHQATPAQLALAWVLRRKGIIAIPKSGTPAHVREDSEALQITLTTQDLKELDEAFPPPTGKAPLEMI